MRLIALAIALCLASTSFAATPAKKKNPNFVTAQKASKTRAKTLNAAAKKKKKGKKKSGKN